MSRSSARRRTLRRLLTPALVAAGLLTVGAGVASASVPNDPTAPAAYTWTGTGVDSDWQNAANWSNTQGYTGSDAYPGGEFNSGDSAIIPACTPTPGTATAITGVPNGLNLTNLTFQGACSAATTVSGGAGNLYVGKLSVDGANVQLTDEELIFTGTGSLIAAPLNVGSTDITVREDASLELRSSLTTTATDNAIENDGLVSFKAGSSLVGAATTEFANSDDGILNVDLTSGAVSFGANLSNFATLHVVGGALAGTGSHTVTQYDGDASVASGATLTGFASLTIRGGTFGVFGTVSNPVTLDYNAQNTDNVFTGTLTGNGTISAALNVINGVVRPATATGAPATLTVSTTTLHDAASSDVNSTGSTVVALTDGTTTSKLGVSVFSTATLAGNLSLTTGDYAAPAANTAFTVVQGLGSMPFAGNVTGAFSSVYENGSADGGYVTAQTTTGPGGSVVLTQHYATFNAPASVVQGAAFTVSGSGFLPGETVDFGYGTGQSGGALGVTAVTDGSGAFTASLTIPAAAGTGDQFTVSVFGRQSFAGLFKPITVTAPAAAPVNQPPTCSATTTLAAIAGIRAVGSLSCTDPENKPLIYGVSVNPLHGSLAVEGATYTYQSQTTYAGTDTFIVGVSDGTTTVKVTVPVTVIAAPKTIVTTPANLVTVLTKLPSSLNLSQVLNSGIVQTVSCNQACTITVSYYVSYATAVKLGLVKATATKTAFGHLKAKPKLPVLVGTATVKTKKAGKVAVKVKLTAKAKKALKGQTKVAISQKVTVKTGKKSKVVARGLTLKKK